jgi:hypothetical protein
MLLNTLASLRLFSLASIMCRRELSASRCRILKAFLKTFKASSYSLRER